MHKHNKRTTGRQFNLAQRINEEKNLKLEAKDVLPNKPPRRPLKGQKMPFSFLVTFTFDLSPRPGFVLKPKPRFWGKLNRNRNVGSRDISYTNKKPQTDGAKNRTFRSSLHVVIKTDYHGVLVGV